MTRSAAPAQTTPPLPLLARLRAAAAARPRRFDAAVALLLFVASLATALLSEVDREVSVAPGVTWPRVPLLALMTAPIAWRRDRPLTVLLVVAAAALAAGLLGFSTGAAAFALVLALVSAAYYRGRTTAIVAAAIGSATLLVMLVAFTPEGTVSSENVAFNVAVVVLALITGDVLRGHREALAELAERNRRLEQLRDVEKREAVTQDRMRIARELHDIVGHALAAVTLQARAGQRLVARDPAAATATFEQIEEVASRALGETRTAVGAMRSGSERAELQPQPTLDDLPELVRAVSTPDVRVTLRSEPAGAVAPAVQASAYRIVQESLANVVKHAGPAAAVVTVAAAADGALRVEVRDDGRGAGAPAAPGAEAARGDGSAVGGSGLGGMRARADQLGGSFSAGPVEGGGWLVSALLPARAGTRLASSQAPDTEEGTR
ncbi:MAG TPA: histidine kinase [Conexibacter sp.]|nr:histidine kinase [Conexibacter sp.]